MLGDLGQLVFCFLEKLSEMRKLTTFYLAKNDHRWVTIISLKTITDGSQEEGKLNGRTRMVHSRRASACRTSLATADDAPADEEQQNSGEAYAEKLIEPRGRRAFALVSCATKFIRNGQQ